MATLHERFLALFGGLKDAYAIFQVKSGGTGKITGGVKTVRKTLTPGVWKSHLNGDAALAVYPCTREATCNFAAIDIDDYSLSFADLEQKIRQIGLPLIVCKSKSGGAHCFLFVDNLSSERVRTTLRNWSVLLGRVGLEIFPKQVRLASPSDTGNCLNMPYFDHKHTTRFAFFDGKPLKAEQFLDLAEKTRFQTIKDLEAWEIADPTNEYGDLLEGAPPCLITLCLNGFKSGTRNNGLFNIGVYLRKRYDENWQEKIDQYNREFMDPPLGHSEVTAIIRSLSSKSYQYKCRDSPINEVCERELCLTKKYGVADDNDPESELPEFGPFIKILTEPPSYIWTINSKNVLFHSTDDILSQTKFQRRCVEELNLWPPTVKGKTWRSKVQEALNNCEVEELPPDATNTGIITEYLRVYCMERAMAQSKEELISKKPWKDEETCRVYFSGPDFNTWLKQQKIYLNPKDLWLILRRVGAQRKEFHIKGRCINTWHVDMFDEQDEDFTLPHIDDMEM